MRQPKKTIHWARIPSCEQEAPPSPAERGFAPGQWTSAANRYARSNLGMFRKGGCKDMDATTIRVIAGVLALVVLGVIVYRRRKAA